MCQKGSGKILAIDSSTANSCPFVQASLDVYSRVLVNLSGIPWNFSFRSTFQWLSFPSFCRSKGQQIEIWVVFIGSVWLYSTGSQTSSSSPSNNLKRLRIRRFSQRTRTTHEKAMRYWLLIASFPKKSDRRLQMEGVTTPFLLGHKISCPFSAGHKTGTLQKSWQNHPERLKTILCMENHTKAESHPLPPSGPYAPLEAMAPTTMGPPERAVAAAQSFPSETI